MSRFAVYVAGGSVNISSAGPTPTSLGPFLARPVGPLRFEFELEFRPLPAPSPQGVEWTFLRRDLVFRLDPSRHRAVAYADTTEGAFLAALELALQVALLDDDALMIHAAAGIVDGCGWLLPGPSGTGKSTAAREAGFDAVLSDERVIVRVHESRIMLWGSPFWSRERTLPLHSGSAQLGVFGRLRQAPRFATSDWASDSALAYLMESVTLYETGAAAVRAFDLAASVVMSAQCLTVDFARTGQWPLRSENAA